MEEKYSKSNEDGWLTCNKCGIKVSTREVRENIHEHKCQGVQR
jgi:hypothetical protein